MTQAENSFLSIRNLVTAFDTEQGSLRAVEDISFSVEKGRTLGIVGESGCGKSVTALSIIRLLPRPAGRIEGGKIWFQGTDILTLPPERLNEIRGNRISMIFQEPLTSLNPVQRIGAQIGEVMGIHFPRMTKEAIGNASLELMEKVGIPDPKRCVAAYPHQISGGMRQRVMIAIALACKPDLLIADEPTTALDVTIQAQILELMKDLQKKTGMAILFITHDLGVIAEVADQVIVMYAGKIVEEASVETLFKNPAHPYTQGLLSSIPRLDSPRKAPLTIIPGMVPSLSDMPAGCRFQNRCPVKIECCETIPPQMTALSETHSAGCHLLTGRKISP
jgi:oligopeptide/dipeptide ABC transporter ATP-binding protein